jgi:hypothetical protein
METFHNITRAIATIAIMADGLYYASTQPGPMDVINGAVAGMVVYAIWFARERTK